MPVLGSDGLPVQKETGYTAASEHHKAMSMWMPRMWRVDDLIKEKGPIEARIQDVSRNNPNISGAIRNQTDAIVGARFRLALRPDNRPLGLDRQDLKDWVQQVEYEWNSYAENPECWIDARRERTFTDLIRIAVGQDIHHGEAMASKEWQSSPLGYKTCFQIVDPTRVCPPSNVSEANADAWSFGIRRNRIGAATGYSVRQNSKKFGEMETYRRIPKYNRFGWLQFIHVYDPISADQGRGISRLAAALATVKQLDRFHETELEQSIIAASYAMFIESQMPDIDQIFSAGGLSPEYQSLLRARNDHREKNPFVVQGARIGQLMPGEQVKALNIGHPNKAFAEFSSSVQRMIARSLGMSFEEFTGDLSRVAYASARASFMLGERFNAVKRETIAKRMANLMFRIWLDEAVDKGMVSPPVDYWRNRTALARAEWIPGRGGQIDDLKTARAREINLRNGFQTMQEIAAEDGHDWEERMEQQKIEAEAKIEAVESVGVTMTEAMKAKILLMNLNRDGDPFDEIDE